MAKNTRSRVVFLIGGIWFLLGSAYFFMKGIWIGGGIFGVAGASFLWSVIGRGRKPR